jgi:hypothetical protein
VTAAVGGHGDDIPPLLRPEIRGEGGLRLRTRTALADGAVQARFGVTWQPGDGHSTSFDGTALSTPLGVGRVYASVERRHWGPSWTGSLILDAGAEAISAIGWRKSDPTPFHTPWLAWLGPWSLDVFGGGLAEANGPHHAHLLGARLQVMPLPGLELGASRTIQWGGSGRPESLRSLANALLGHDNTSAGSSDAAEPGNQLGGFDARYTLSLGERRTLSIYGQAIGEDEAGGLPSHYLGSIGIDAAFAVDATTVRLFVEHANTTLNGMLGTPILGSAYRHAIYTDGYTQRGKPLGHPVGGDVRLTSIGAIVDGGAWGATLMVHDGSAYPTATLYPGGGTLSGGNAALNWQLDPASRVGIELAHWHDPGGTWTRAQLWWRYSFRRRRRRFARCARASFVRRRPRSGPFGYCSSAQAKPSRATSALAAAGPQVPAV